MPADPREAGRKGGSKNSPAQQEARKKNWFQKVAPEAPTPAPEPKVEPTPTSLPTTPVLFAARKDS